MTIGLALAGLAAISFAASPGGAKSLMGLLGTPEEHLAKFKEYLAHAQNAALPTRVRLAAVAMAWAEADWTPISDEDRLALNNVQALLDMPDLPVPGVAPAAKARARLVRSEPKEPKGTDHRHPPFGWKRNHTFKGNSWLIVSMGNGMYEARQGGQVVLTGTGNTVASKIHGHEMNVYDAFKLGGPGSVFNPASPPSGWFQ